MEEGDALARSERLAIVVLAVASSVLLLVLQRGVDAEAAWIAHPGVRIAAFAIAAGAPLAAALSVGLAVARVAAIAVGYALAYGGTGYAFGTSALTGGGGDFTAICEYALLAWLGGFVALPLAQGVDRGWHYPRLYRLAWRNALLLVLTFVFTGLFWIVLALWAGLFALIGFDFFAELFEEDVFHYPVTGLVVGLGLNLLNGLDRVVTAARWTVRTLLWALLPLLAALGLLFAAGLVLAGVTPLWETASAASLLAWLVLLHVVFTATTFGDGEGARPYPRVLDWPLRAALAILPVFAGLAVYALWLRVAQHGWTHERVYAAVVLTVLALYAVGYAVAAVLPSRGRWLAHSIPVNIAMAWVTVAAAVALATPVLDARAIAVADQLARLHSRDVSAEDFDYRYLARQGGRHGREALVRLERLEDHPQAASIRERAEAAIACDPACPEAMKPRLAERVPVRPESAAPLPEAVWQAFEARSHERAVAQCRSAQGRECRLLVADFDGDGGNDYALLPSRTWLTAPVLARSDGGWRLIGRLRWPQCTGCDVDDMRSRLDRGEWSMVAPGLSVPRIGGRTLAVEPLRGDVAD